MATIQICTKELVKKIKPMHGGGQPPIGGKELSTYFHYVAEAGIPSIVASDHRPHIAEVYF